MIQLTENQWSALRAVAGKQKTAQSLAWWAAARARWPGPRKTLGSLLYRGLVDYSHETGWTITDAGAKVLEEVGQ